MKHYENEDGYLVFTAHHHRQRGRCCKSSCLHCPFGHTLNTVGIEIKEASDLPLLQKTLESFQSHHYGVTASLLESAFAAPKTITADLTNLSDFYYLYLKGVLCGVYKKTEEQLLLGEHFKDQGITKEYIKSLF